jgi:hypothetical protein
MAVRYGPEHRFFGEFSMQGQLIVQRAGGIPAQLLPAPRGGPCRGPAAGVSRVPRGADDGPVLRFGFTYQHVQAIAGRMVRDGFAARGLPWEERFGVAFGAVAECLYAADGPVSSADLARAAANALSRLERAELREHGYGYNPADRRHRDRMAGPWSARSALRYWQRPALATPEEKAVDRAALWQVLDALAPSHARVLLTLAETGDRDRAAAALGMTRHAFGNRLGEARAAFLRLWHEHEAPSRLWRQDSPTGGAASGPPASRAEAARVLADVRDAFGGGQALAATADLLVRLAAADPARYGNWTPKDLAGFLRPCGAPSHTIRAADGEGRQRKCQGYRLDEVTRALQDLDLAAPGIPAGQAA